MLVKTLWVYESRAEAKESGHTKPDMATHKGAAFCGMGCEEIAMCARITLKDLPWITNELLPRLLPKRGQ